MFSGSRQSEDLNPHIRRRAAWCLLALVVTMFFYGSIAAADSLLEGPYTPAAGLSAYCADTGGSVYHSELGTPSFGQCVWFVRRVRPDNLPSTSPSGCAYDMWNNAVSEHWHRGVVPKRGAVMCFNQFRFPPCGHVAVVTRVNGDGTVDVWDSNFSTPEDGKVRKRRVTNFSGLQGYIYAKDSDTPPILQGGPPPNPPVLVAPGDNTHFIGHPFLDWKSGGGHPERFQAKFGGEWSEVVTTTGWRAEQDHGNGSWSARAWNSSGGWSDFAPGRYLWAYVPEQAFGYAKAADPNCLGPWQAWNDISGESCPTSGVWRIYPSGPDSQVMSSAAYFYWGGQTTPGEWLTYTSDPFVQVEVEAANHTDLNACRLYFNTSGEVDDFTQTQSVLIPLQNTGPDITVSKVTAWFSPNTARLRFDPINGMPSNNPFGDGSPYVDLKAIRFLRYVTWPKWIFDIQANRKGWVTYGISPTNYPQGGEWKLAFTVNHPYLYTPKLQIAGEEWGSLRLVMANHTSVPVARVYYKATEGGSWVPLTDTIATATDGEFHTYEMPINVTGPIARIRIDPVGGGNSSVPGSYCRLKSFELVEADATYTLSLAGNPADGGTVAVNGTSHTLPWSGEVGAGSSVSLTAVEADGYAFSNWSGDASGSANPLVLTMDGDKSITANFTVVGTSRLLSVPHVLAGIDAAEISVPLELDDVADVAGIDFTVTFDPTVVQCQDVQNTDCTSGWLVGKNIDNVNGTCTVSMASSVALSTCSGPVAEIIFAPAPGASPGDSTALDLSEVTLFDEEANPIAVLSQSGSITFSGCEDPYDVDRDGGVNSADAILLLRAAVGEPPPDGWSYDWPPLECNDVNGDRVINSADAILVLRHAVGLSGSPVRTGVLRAASRVTPRILSAPSLTTGQVGDSVVFPISIDNAGGIAGMDISLLFDPSVVTAVSVNTTSATDDLLMDSHIDNAGGSVSVSLAGTTARPAGPAVLLEVVFEIVGAPTDSCLVHFDVHSLYDAEAQLIESSASDGTIQVDFPDVSSDHWAHDAVVECVAAGIVSGYGDGCYHPDWEVTRDQMAVYMARALAGGDENVPTGPATATFSDVPTDHWAYKYIEYCVVQGIVQGYWDGYHPDDTVDRAQMAVYVARAVAGSDANVPDGPETATFDDVPTDHWAYKYVEYCHAQGIVQGYDSVTYAPDVVVTRDQMAVYVARAFSLTM